VAEGHGFDGACGGFTFAIVGLMNGILFALLRVLPPPHG
jgi:hypothetical protein